MAETLVLQKLLNTTQATSIVQAGADQVGGYVSAASAVAGLRTPADVLAAHGIDASPEFVDVVRFEQPRLTNFTVPPVGERPWPTFPTGFLRGDSFAPVWLMSRTRYSYGAEYWRIRHDGEQKVLSRYEGAARGWMGAQRWRPPSPIVGTLAKWQNAEFFADVVADSVLLTSLGQEAPAGFDLVHPGVWSAIVPLADCEVFERVITAELDGVPVRLLQNTGGRADVLLLTDEPDVAESVGAGLVESAVYELEVSADRLVNLRGVDNLLVPNNG